MKKKRILNAHDVFYAQIKIFLQKAVVWRYTVHKIFMLCVFRCAGTILL